jgi:hypothetical protein
MGYGFILLFFKYGLWDMGLKPITHPIFDEGEKNILRKNTAAGCVIIHTAAPRLSFLRPHSMQSKIQ